MNLLELAWRNVLRNRRRTALTLAAIGVGAMAILLLGGYVSATVKALQTDTVRQAGHLQIMAPGLKGGGAARVSFAAKKATRAARRSRAQPPSSCIPLVMRHYSFVSRARSVETGT